MTTRNSKTWHPTTHIIAMLVTLVVASASHAEDALDRNREVSYLVFQRAAGFDSPQYRYDLVDGTVTVRFRRLPAHWQGLLEPQITTARKQRFFKGFIELKENDKLVGFKVRLGIGTATLRGYVKTNPKRWILRIGDSRTPPFTRGTSGLPIVPYADLIEEDTAGRDKFTGAELEYAAGNIERAHAIFQKLRTTTPEIAPWAAIREADCLMESGQLAMATELLRIVAKKGGTPSTRLLARLRLGEVTGAVKQGRFLSELYTIDNDQIHTVGTIADEVAYRAARTHLFRGEPTEALKGFETLLSRRPQSPFFDDMTLIFALRWRALRDLVLEKEWLAAARTYLKMPSSNPAANHWVDLHMAGAEALRRIALPERAIEVYLHLLRSKQANVDELNLMSQLAESYNEAGDEYRAQLTLDYIAENYPNWRKNRTLVRLQGDLALKKDKLKTAAQVAGELMNDPLVASEDDSQLAVAAALSTLNKEGIVAARAIAKSASATKHKLPLAVDDELAFIAGDCQSLEQSSRPLELASAKKLLWTAVCLSRAGRVDEALVYLQATQAFAAEELADPDLWPLVELIKESALWWKLNNNRIDDSNQNGAVSPQAQNNSAVRVIGNEPEQSISATSGARS